MRGAGFSAPQSFLEALSHCGQTMLDPIAAFKCFDCLQQSNRMLSGSMTYGTSLIFGVL
jgi:hypothetical protein